MLKFNTYVYIFFDFIFHNLLVNLEFGKYYA